MEFFVGMKTDTHLQSKRSSLPAFSQEELKTEKGNTEIDGSSFTSHVISTSAREFRTKKGLCTATRNS